MAVGRGAWLPRIKHLGVYNGLFVASAAELLKQPAE
jgi:hypothetical protein